MTTTAPHPSPPPTGWPQPRWGIFFRRHARERFALLLTTGSEGTAWDALAELMRASKGDWSVRQLQPGEHGKP